MSHPNNAAIIIPASSEIANGTKKFLTSCLKFSIRMIAAAKIENKKGSFIPKAQKMHTDAKIV